ncbi:anaerobic sulfatase maturase [Vibrio mediterranei]|uniref:anaerobic sulfatase maturase n=1 Tax=Vibrio mediterranei TaxID=689 RepID=UPI0040689476
MYTIKTPQFKGKVAKRLHVMAKPIGAVCNIDCKYCYYLSKKELLQYDKNSSPIMDKLALETYIRQYIEGQNTPEIIFSWQGGEPTLLGLEYFKKVVELQNKYKPEGVIISNDLQTNGILLNEEWCNFLKNNNFLVGLSIDGPEIMHNAYRVNRTGRGTFKQVMEAVELLHKYRVPFATLTCVNNLTSRNPLEVYRFLRDEVRSTQLQFIPIVERKDFRVTSPQHWKSNSQFKQGDKRLIPGHPDSMLEPWSVADAAWGNFLVEIFDEWVKYDLGKIIVPYFEASLETWRGNQNPLCTLSDICGKGLAMEPNGDVFSCDHYVYPEFKIGNIHHEKLEELAYSSKQQEFGYSKIRSLPNQCIKCDYQFACYGECPKNRFIKTREGEMGLNYLCAGWKNFFSHADKTLSYLLRATGNHVVNGKYTS